MKNISVAVSLTVLGALASCSDTGTDPPPAAQPVVLSVQPDSAAVGDTITIAGTGFGPSRGTSTVAIGLVTFVSYPIWSESQIRAVVPSGAQSATIRVVVDGVMSNGVPYIIRGTGPVLVSFATDVQPILNFGCAIGGCHVPPGPAGSYNLTTYAGVRAGGVSYGSSVVIPGDSTASEIIRSMRGTATVGRMPFGGPWVSTGVPDSLIRTVARWIQQGAQNN